MAEPTTPLGLDGDTTIEIEDFTSSTDSTPGNGPGDYRTDTDTDIVAGATGHYVGWTSPGETLTYDLTVARPGTYRGVMSVQTALGQDLTIDLTVDGVTVPVTVPGAQTEDWVEVPVTLPDLDAGSHTLTLRFNGGGIKADYLDLAWSPLPHPVAATGTTRVEAEDFASGVDTTSGNTPGAYRNDTDVDVAAGATGYYVGWTSSGESVSYDLQVAEGGDHTASLAMQTSVGRDRALAVLVDGVEAGTVTVPGAPTNGWTTVSLPLTLPAGDHSLTVRFDASGVKLDYLDLAGVVAFTPAYPGRPAAGDVAWGANYGGDAGSTVEGRYEDAAGQPLEVNRTFYQWKQMNGALLRQVDADVAAGRIPWVSVKGNPGGQVDWTGIGDGAYDADLDAMLLALDAHDAPIILTVHHEPEGGGVSGNTPDDPAGPAAHVRMNTHVRERMDAVGIENVALAPILMAYTWDDRSGRDPDAWWVDGVYDFLGVDAYSFTDGQGLAGDALVGEVRQWAAQKGVDIGIGEWGMRGDGHDVRAWYDDAVGSADDGRGARIVIQTVFDNPGGEHGPWTLDEAQLAEFIEILDEQ
ncbi:MAG: carbohydrate-binding protein [Acidimicrobiales bacterium]